MAGGGARATSSMAPEEVRLLVKVARMYHERGIRQPQIAAQLGLSQPRVCRLLRQAAALGIVRTVVPSTGHAIRTRTRGLKAWVGSPSEA